MKRTMSTTKLNRLAGLVMALALMVIVSPLWAQEETSMEHMNHETKPDALDSKPAEMDMHDKEQPSSMSHSMGQSMSHGHTDMTAAPVHDRTVLTNDRDPHAYSDGYDFGPIARPRLADEKSFGALWVNRLESVHSDDNTWTTYDLQGWYGRNYDRAILKAEGDVDNGTLEYASTELLWNHAISTFWNTEFGLRYDSGEGPNRSWLAFGIQGLAPYWFELGVTTYLGESGRGALEFEAEYELLLTQKMVLQPRLEATFYNKDDPDRALGSGLTDMTVGMRLRYEIRREFAPYVGIEWVGLFDDTANYARATGQTTDDTHLVAGLRFWF